MIIEKKIKMPSSIRNTYDVPWDEMNPGDSVLVKLISHVDGRSTLYAQAHRKGIKMKASKIYAEDGSYIGLRIWVVEKKPLTKS